MTAIPTPAAILKDEPGTRIRIFDDPSGRLVRKHHRQRPKELWKWCMRRARTHREFALLKLLRAAGVPCVEPIAWSELRRGVTVYECSLTTRLLDGVRTLEEWLEDPRATRPERQSAVRHAGALLRRMHRAGFLWCSCAPRNFLVQGAPSAGRVFICDTPYAMDVRRDVSFGTWSVVDLFPGCFSAHRRRQLEDRERRAFIDGYGDGETERMDALRTRCEGLTRRQFLWRKNLSKFFFGHLRPHRIPRFNGPEHKRDHVGGGW